MAGIISGATNTFGSNADLTKAWKSNPYWDSAAEGSVSNYGNGTLTRGAGNTATYKANGDTGAGYTFNKDQSVDSVADGSEDIANVWSGQYDINQNTTPAFRGGAATGSTAYAVDPKTMTVQSQLKGILDPNSELMQQSRTLGLQTAADRGIINSSMAQTGALDSMLRTAVPIATSDASTYAKAASDNANNATSITNANTGARSSWDTANIAANTSVANTASNNATSRENAALGEVGANLRANNQNATTLANTTLNEAGATTRAAGQNATTLANTTLNEAGANARTTANNEASRQNTILQTEATKALGLNDQAARQLTAGSASATSLLTNYQSNLTSIMRDPVYTTPEARKSATDALMNSTTTGLQLIGQMAGDLDISAFIDAMVPA